MIHAAVTILASRTMAPGDRESTDPRDAFLDQVALPRGLEREWGWARSACRVATKNNALSMIIL
jgi:hypothetical protein